MKYIITSVFLLLGIFVFSQDNAFETVSQNLKKSSKIDKNDKTIVKLLDRLYQEGLQSDKGEFSTEIPKLIDKTLADKNLKNAHILLLFLMYQDYISNSAATGKSTNSKYQVQMMNFLYNECKEVWGKVPTIIYIYSYEALDSDNKMDESAKIISEGLAEYPDSVPLKVYKYIVTRDSSLKEDLLKNHSNHWMVLQFKINS